MYPFERLRPAYDRYWTAVHRRAPWLPAELRWDIDLRASWTAADLIVAQTCGWPLVTKLADRVRVVGAFEPLVPGAAGHLYRSTLVARTGGSARSFIGARAAANSQDSLSGWVSLAAAVHGPGQAWTGPVVWTGSHLGSIRAVRDGHAEIASIDSVSWAHALRFEPATATGLVEIGHGPLVPSLPVVTAMTTDDRSLELLRVAMSSAFDDDDAANFVDEIKMSGFVPLDIDAYVGVRDLAPPTSSD